MKCEDQANPQKQRVNWWLPRAVGGEEGMGKDYYWVWNFFPKWWKCSKIDCSNGYTTVAVAAAAESLQSCPTLCDPIDGSPPGSPPLGFSRQEHWSELPFPSPMHETNSERGVAQSCWTLRDPMECSLPGSSVHGIFQARVLEWGATASSGLIY